MEYCYVVLSSDELYHHGVKGMHWGVRRYQNPDGTLTSKGLTKYRSKIASLSSKNDKLRRKSDKFTKKAEKYEAKSVRPFRSNSKYIKFSKKSDKSDVKANKVNAKISKNEKKINKIQDIINKASNAKLKDNKSIEAGKQALAKMARDPEVKRKLDGFKKDAQYHDQLVKKGENIENYLSAPKSWDSREPKSKMEKRINSAKNSSTIKKAGAEYYISRNEADTNTGKVSEYFKLKANQDKKKFTKLLDDAGVKYNMKKDIDVEYGPMYLHKYTTNKQRFIYDRY